MMIRKTILFSAALAVLITLQAQQPTKNCPPPSDQQKPVCQKSQVCHAGCQQGIGSLEVLFVEQFAKLIADGGVLLLDVRTPKEYAVEQIEGAKNVAWGNDFKEQLKRSGVKPCRPVAVYCRSGRRSNAAANVLVQMGYKVYDLEGGIIAWSKAGKPVAKQ